jgi:hypothetical protein
MENVVGFEAQAEVLLGDLGFELQNDQTLQAKEKADSQVHAVWLHGLGALQLEVLFSTGWITVKCCTAKILGACLLC